MKKLEKLLDIIELYIPMAAFAAMFISYVILILYRYVFYQSIQAINEISIVAYSWSAVLCYSYCERKAESVSFSIVYNRLPPKVQRVVRLAGNAFVFVTFGVLLPYAYDFVSFMRIKKTPILKIPFSIVYAPFVVFVSLTFLHYLIKIIRDLRPGQRN